MCKENFVFLFGARCGQLLLATNRIVCNSRTPFLCEINVYPVFLRQTLNGCTVNQKHRYQKDGILNVNKTHFSFFILLRKNSMLTNVIICYLNDRIALFTLVPRSQPLSSSSSFLLPLLLRNTRKKKPYCCIELINPVCCVSFVHTET